MNERSAHALNREKSVGVSSKKSLEDLLDPDGKGSKGNSVTLSIVGESVGRFVREKARGCLDDSTMDAMMKSVYARELERCVSDWSLRRPGEEVSIVLIVLDVNE